MRLAHRAGQAAPVQVSGRSHGACSCVLACLLCLRDSVRGGRRHAEDNNLKIVCDFITIIVCACELSHGRDSLAAAQSSGANAYTIYFDVAMAFVAVCCVLAIAVKMCRLMVHMGRGAGCASRVLDLVGGVVHGNDPPDDLRAEYEAIRKYRALGALSKHEEQLLRKHFKRVEARIARSGGRAAGNLNFEGAPLGC